MEKSPSNDTGISRPATRRNFLKASSILVAGGTVASNLPIARSAHSFGSDEIRVGLVGCGGRGTGAAIQALNTEGPVKLVSLCDVQENRISSAYRSIKGKHRDRVDVAEQHKYVGFDGYKRVLDSDIDLVILATPPGFRPMQFEAAVQAGKHVFMEKPVAVDAPGVRRILAANEIAKSKNLAVQVGLQRHHQTHYKETIERLQQGMIGDFLFARAYWNGTGAGIRERSKRQTELEFQMNNWQQFNWLSGDSICERHIHNIDVINWMMQAYPIEAQGQGGRQIHSGARTGETFDHHFVEYTYASGTKLISQCRTVDGCWSQVGEFAHGTRGWADIAAGKIFDIGGNLLFEATRTQDGWEQEQKDLFASLRNGERPNETEYAALSTMTAIMGRMATYTGAKLSWETCFHSNVSLADFDSIRDFGSSSPTSQMVTGQYATAIPGVDKRRHV